MSLKRKFKYFLDTLHERGTIVGKFFWIINSVLFICFTQFILKLLLEPFGYLDGFICMVGYAIDFLIAVYLWSKNFTFFDFLNRLPLYIHILTFFGVIILYIYSLNILWKNKTEYPQQ